MDEKTKILAIYMSEDKEVLLNLSGRLDTLDKTNSISWWNDESIEPKQRWVPKDASHLKNADIFLFLISDAFMHSEFIKQIDFKNIIDRYKDGNAEVIPVLIDDCPWNIDFKADEYTFNFNELQVLPEGEKPLKNWKSIEEAYDNSVNRLKGIILPHLDAIEEEVDEVMDENTTKAIISEEQIAIDFEKEVEANMLLEEKREKQIRAAEEEAEIAKAKLEAENAAKEELRLKEEAEAKRLVKEEKKRIEAKAVEEKLAKEKRIKEESEATKRVKEELILKEAEAKRIADEERVSEEIEAKRIAVEEEQRLKKEETIRIAEENQNQWEDDERQPAENNGKKKVLIGVLVAAILLVGIFVFSGGDTDEMEQDIPILTENETVVIQQDTPNTETVTETSAKTTTLGAGANIKKLSVGKRHEGGLIFEVDQNGNFGKIVHADDFGPMTWKEAMKIDEKLGEGWRVPTFDELRKLYKTVGQGADNKGEFADELYWSATPYDANQAKMVRFSDGNTSYHYNRRGTHRKYLVRAIKDFKN